MISKRQKRRKFGPPDPDAKIRQRARKTTILAKTGGNPMERERVRLERLAKQRGELMVWKPCRFCGEPFGGSPAWVASREHCSAFCRMAKGYWTTPKGEARTTALPSGLNPYPRKRKSVLDTVSKMLTTLASGTLSPGRAAQMRGKIAAIIERHLDTADAVLNPYDPSDSTGATPNPIKWTPTQARVFATLMTKVVPDLSVSSVQHEHTHRHARNMTIAELEAMLLDEVGPAIEGTLIHEPADGLDSQQSGALLDLSPEPARAPHLADRPDEQD